MGRLLDKARWHRLSRHQLQIQPLCEMCLEEGRVEPATVVDHVEPHHNDAMKFWFGKLRNLCKLHHDASKRRIEQRGYDTRIGIDGLPVDKKNHPFYLGYVPARPPKPKR